jgi:hypothetical protein
MKTLINLRGLDSDFGPITCCTICVDDNCEQDNPIDMYVKTKSEKIFNSDILKFHNISSINARDVDGTQKQISKLVFDSLNSVYEFWKTDIFILSKNISLNDVSDNEKQFNNIKKAKVYIGERFYNKKLVNLLNYVHDCYYNKEIKLLKSVYEGKESIHDRRKE